MKSIARFLVFVFAALVGSMSAHAGGSSPGLHYGQVPTAAQWNSYFASKLDYTPGSANAIPYWDGSGSLLNAPISGDCTSAANVFTCTIGGAGIHAATSKTTPVDADELPIADSATTPTPYGLKKLTFANLKAWEATYFANIAGSSAHTFDVAPATASTHAVRSGQISADNTNFPIYTAPASWAPTYTGFTFGGVTTSTAIITKIGRLRFFTLRIVDTVSIACTEGATTYITGLPTPAYSSTVGVTYESPSPLGTGLMFVNGRLFPPTISAGAGVAVIFSGVYIE